MKTILCIADFTLCSENAFRYAYELASLLKARLLLFYNMPATALTAPASAEKNSHSDLVTRLEERNEYVKLLEATKRRLTYDDSGSHISCETMVRHGEAKENIRALVQEEQADLVVLGNEAADAVQDILTGSIAGGLIEKVACPVLVVPQQASFQSLRKIVFAVDQISEPYQDASLVFSLARLFSAEVHVLHVLPKDNGSATTEEEIYPLASWNDYNKVSYHLLIHDSIEEGISQFCREHRVDMLVLGYHAENPWQHLRRAAGSPEDVYHTYLPVLFTHYKKQEQK